MQPVVVALGGNALGKSPKEQLEKVKISSKAIVDIIENNDKVAIVHGNGPQVGVINLAFNEAGKVDSTIPTFPLVECVALSQGYIGYHLQQAVRNELNERNLDKNVSTVITEVEVDGDDPAFEDPSKPIGSFYTKEEAEEIEKKDGYTFREDAGRGYRRVVASPKPLNIVEIGTIGKLLDLGEVVITGGGGGIPIIKDSGRLSGVDAVIDKDFVASKLARDIGADTLVILTAVDNVCINYNKENEEKLEDLTVKKAQAYIEEGQFAKGSMLPKIEACINFIGSDPKKKAIITSLDKAGWAIQGRAGTVIHL